MKKIIGTLVLLAFSGSLQANTLVQTNTFSGQPNYSSILTFDQFDDNSGTYTLNSILISVELNTLAGANLGIDNDGAESAAGQVEFGSSGSIVGATVALNKNSTSTFSGALSSLTSKAMNLEGDDGDTTTYSTEGNDFDSLTTTATSESDSAYIWSAVFDGYTGTGTYDITYGVSQFMNMGSFSGSQFQGDPVGAGGQIVITYDYTVPEPTSASLMLVLFAAAAWIRRRFFE